ncbi:DUF6083 domain-containing protein [Streptacidiphilus fuscans]|uniref:Uncharacterized protein n=1 Tax=Streptacidiphilus fuscans TaxID=2789292 RepID=A0A931AY27_9ACTN|nr:DUF6083 domain-containing protein [Streptacidiphilus fuscans]MBF9066836.1 hypothetical protein [Streptacidiphilus fuscans]
MGRRGEGQHSCQRCQSTGDDVEQRGRAVPLGWLCDKDWADAVRIAVAADGSTGWPEEDPDDLTFHEPQPCPDCGAPLTYFITNYGRRIALEADEVPAKTIPSRYQWRLLPTTARNSRYVIRLTAVHFGGIEPLPDTLVRPAHAAVCPAPTARDQVDDERVRDLARARRRLAHPEQDAAG